MKEILRKIEEVYNSICAKDAESSRILADAQARESAVKIREERVAGIESAQAVLATAQAIKDSNLREFARIEEEHIKFDNWMREERQALANEVARLAPLKDQEKDLAKMQQNLYDREQALEREKKEFKERYIAKIKAHFANTGKEPNPHDIT